MADSIAKAYLQIVPTAKGIGKSIGEAIGPDMPRAGKAAGKTLGGSLIGKVKGIIATAGIGAAFGKAISEGGALEQSIGGIETLFKENADQVIANARQAYKTAGMDANSYMELTTSFAASLLQGLSGDTKKAGEIADMAMTDMSDNANKMGTDMERITDAYQGFAKQNYTMLDNLKLGYGGTKTEMERLLADAQKISGVEYDIDNLSDVYSAIHEIQGELEITGTTAKEADETLQGSAAAMKSAFTNVLADLTMGEDLKPSLEALSETVITFFAGNLLPAVGRILSGLPTILQGALSLAIQSLNMVAGNAEKIVQMGIEMVTGIGMAIVEAMPYLAEAAFSLVTALGGAIMSTDWVEVATTTITAMRNSLDLAAGEILGTDGNIVQSVLDAISERLPSVLDSGITIIANVANGILQNLPRLLASAGDIMNRLLNAILSALPQILQAGVTLIGRLASGLLQNLPAIISAAAQILSQLLATIARHLPQMLQTGLELIGKLAVGLIQAIPKVIASIPRVIRSITDAFKRFNWRQLGTDIIRGLINGLGSMGGALWQAAKNVANSVLGSIKRALGIHSPSRVMRDQVGKFIPAGVAVGIDANTKPLKESMEDVADISTEVMAKGMRATNSLRPAASVAAGSGPKNVNIYVYGAQGQDVEELAEIVMDRITNACNMREAGIA